MSVYTWRRGNMSVTVAWGYEQIWPNLRGEEFLNYALVSADELSELL
jgi:hypothetical protein